jgi:hypothetical protein
MLKNTTSAGKRPSHTGAYRLLAGYTSVCSAIKSTINIDRASSLEGPERQLNGSQSRRRLVVCSALGTPLAETRTSRRRKHVREEISVPIRDERAHQAVQ